LPYLQASLFGTILEDTITQLRILVECNNELRIIKVKSDWTYLLSMKFGINQPKSIDELEGIDLHNLGCNEYKINKLDKDRKFITDVVTATYVDLSLNKSFKALEDYNIAIMATDEYRVSLTEVAAKNKVYTDNWQRARTEQHIKTIYDVEITHSESIEYYKQRSDHEQRVHSEIELLINIVINITHSESIEYYKQRSDHEQRVHSEIELLINIVINITHSESIEYYKQRSDHEQRAHSEIELLINIVINSIEYYKQRSDHEQRVHSEIELLIYIVINKIEDCMNKFDKDMEAIDLKIHVK
ncbi:putative IQ motif containing G, partial [Operophtera brumata]